MESFPRDCERGEKRGRRGDGASNGHGRRGGFDSDRAASGHRRSCPAIPGPDAVWVLEDGDRVVGHADVHEAGSGVLLLGIAILPEARGLGGGRALLEAIVEHGRACGAHKLELEVWSDNARAIALYASAGFEVEGLRRDHYRRRDGSLRSALLMARLLSPDEH